jgi:protein O-GlcNAc transferase
MTPSMLDRAMQMGKERHRNGRLAEAETIYRQVLAHRPGHSEPWQFLGILAAQAGRPGVAVELIRRAVALDPRNPGAFSDLGNALQACGRLDEAMAAHRRALEIEPAFVKAYNNLGGALRAAGRLDEAIDACREALRLEPHFASAHNNLGNYLKDQGRLDLAVECYRKAVALEPAAAGFHSNLAYTVCFLPSCDAGGILAESLRWEEQHAQPLARSISPHANEPTPDRKLRIGYVSPDFRTHVVGWNLLPLLREHDRRQFEIFCYANVVFPDALTEQFRGLSDQWRDIAGVADARVAEIIRADRIDILVDLTLHMAYNRLPVFARKPAPVQATYLGYCGTTGLKTIDYRLSDPYLDPPGTDLSCYREATVRLPRSYWCYQPGGPSPELSPAPLATTGRPTFGCLNDFAKVSPEALELWIEILRLVPESRLLLHVLEGRCRERILEQFARRGLAEDRIEMVGRKPWPEYVRELQRIDVALDPFPYGGGITTCDALWMGVPVVSFSGRTAVGRGGRSILSNIGLPELIAETSGQYLEIAVALAGDLPRLNALRSSLRERLEASPLRNAKGFARDVEAAYRGMWREWCERAAGS